MNSIYTVGHSQHSLDKFLSMLKTYDINYVLDVRSTPFSKYAPQFNKDALKLFLNNHNINYTNMAKSFGARQSDASLYTSEGYLDFEKTKNTLQFRLGFDNVLKGLNNGNRIAFMCTEKIPNECHRSIMVTKSFSDTGIPIKHILEDCSYITQGDIDNQLLDMYFPDRYQYSIFNYFNEDDNADLITRAYKLRNKDIGYHMEAGNLQSLRG